MFVATLSPSDCLHTTTSQLCAVKTLQIAVMSTLNGKGGVSCEGVKIILNTVILPLVTDLMTLRSTNNSNTNTAAGASSAPLHSLDDVQTASCSLLSQTFLLYVELLAGDPEFQIIWVKILGLLEKHLRMQPPPSETLRDGVLQSIRNLVMVCHSTGVLARVNASSGQDVLGLTWTLIDAVCPDLQAELTAIGRGDE